MLSETGWIVRSKVCWKSVKSVGEKYSLLVINTLWFKLLSPRLLEISYCLFRKETVTNPL